MNDATLRPYSSISIISGLRAGDNERLCAIEPSLHSKDSRLKRVSSPGLLDQHLLSYRGSCKAGTPPNAKVY